MTQVVPQNIAIKKKEPEKVEMGYIMTNLSNYNRLSSSSSPLKEKINSLSPELKSKYIRDNKFSNILKTENGDITDFSNYYKSMKLNPYKK